MNAVETDEAVPARAEKGSGHHEGLENTEAIGIPLNQANDTVTRLTSLIYNRFKSDPDKVHAWKQAYRIERAPRKKQPAPEPEA